MKIILLVASFIILGVVYSFSDTWRLLQQMRAELEETSNEKGVHKVKQITTHLPTTRKKYTVMSTLSHMKKNTTTPILLPITNSYNVTPVFSTSIKTMLPKTTYSLKNSTTESPTTNFTPQQVLSSLVNSTVTPLEVVESNVSMGVNNNKGGKLKLDTHSISTKYQ